MFRHDGIARSATAATRGRNDHIEIRQVLKYFETDRADACDQLRLVRRMDITVTFGSGNPLRFEPGFVEIASMQTDFGAEFAHRLHLRFIYLLGRRINDHPGTQEPAVIS